MSHEMEIVNTGEQQSSAASLVQPLPAPRVPIAVRLATMDDLPFIDSLQKKNTKMVGWFPTKTIEGKIRAGHVLIAESDEATERRSDKGEENTGSASLSFPSVAPSLRRSVASSLGYLIGNDQYFKHDDIGIIYQINVVEGHRRGFIGATLLKAQFERSAYGCRLYCCWCAQDIEANRFWESMGFVPLAFRAGSEKKRRVHIFWQKRIRTGDESTPFWFPAQTNSGSIREDRLVLPIPPGKSWSDEMPRILPGVARASRPCLEGKAKKTTGKMPVVQKPTKMLGGWSFNPPTPVKPEATKAKREPKPKVKNDPKLVAAARELRDRWLERVNETPMLSQGKYDVCRALTDQSTPRAQAKTIASAKKIASAPALPMPLAA